jgi:excisionase family DNA binding protein
MLTAAQVCEQLGISRETLRKLINDGEIAAMKAGPRNPRGHWRISEAALDDYIKRNTVNAGPEAAGQ